MPGDGRDGIEDFDSGSDRIVLRGVAPDTLKASWSTVGGILSVELAYGTSGDAVVLAGVDAFVAGDLVFA